MQLTKKLLLQLVCLSLVIGVVAPYPVYARDPTTNRSESSSVAKSFWCTLTSSCKEKANRSSTVLGVQTNQQQNTSLFRDLYCSFNWKHDSTCIDYRLSSLSQTNEVLEEQIDIRSTTDNTGLTALQVQMIKGDKGEKGETGNSGKDGNNGSDGLNGVQGLKGEKGDKGDQGLSGNGGAKGDKGDKGDRGDAGASYSAGTGISISGTSISTSLGTSIEAAEITDGTITLDKLASNSCSNGQVPKYNSTSEIWECGADAGGTSYSASGGLQLASGVFSVVLNGSSLSQSASGLKIASGGVTATELASSVAGNGLTGGSGTALAVNTDDSTIELSSDTIRIKDSGVTNAKITDSTLTFAKWASNSCSSNAVIRYNGSNWVCDLSLDTDTSLTANSDTRLATQKAAKAYADARISGLNWKSSVTLMDTTNTAKPTTATPTIDGVALQTGNTVIFTGLTDAEVDDNGKICTATLGSPTTWSCDASTNLDIRFIISGTANGNKQYTYNGTNWTQAGSMTGALQANNNLSDLTNVTTARSNLGLVIGTNVQAYHARLADIAGLTPTDGVFVVGNGTNFVTESGATARTSLGLGTADSPTFTGININSENITDFSGTGLTVTTNALGLASGGVTAAHLAAAIAGNGLSGGAGTALAVSVDGSTIELNADALRLKDGGVTNAKITDGTLTFAKWASNSCSSNGLIRYNGSAWVCDLGLDTDTSLTSNSDLKISSQKAVKTYTDARLNGLSWKSPVTLLDTTLASKPATTVTQVGGATVTNGNTAIFTNLSINNNQVCTATVSGSDITWGSCTDATNLDTRIVTSGTNANKQFNYNGSSWVQINAVSGYLTIANNLSDLNNAGTARTNLGLGNSDSPTFTGLTLSGTTAVFSNAAGIAITSSGSNAPISITTNGSGALTLDSGTTGALNIGTGSNAKTITVGNNTGATAVNLIAGTGGINLTGALTLTGDLLPDGDGTRTLGDATHKWKDLYLSGSTLYLGGVAISNSSGVLTWSGASGISASGGTSTLGTAAITTANITTANITNLGADLSAANNLVLNIGAAGTDFTSGGGLTLAGTLVTNGASITGTQTISNLATGGDIGAAAATVDVATSFNINQTTSGQTITLPSPTTATAGRLAYVNNIGTTSFTLLGSTVTAASGRLAMWNGTAWTLVGDGGSSGSGSASTTIQAVSSSSTLTTWSRTVKADATSGSVTVTLPTAVGNSGQLIEVYKTDNSTNFVKISAYSGQTMDEITKDIYLYNQGESVVLRSDNSNVLTVSQNKNGDVATITNWQTDAFSIESTGTAPSGGTVTINKRRWRRVGQNMEIEYDYNMSVAGSNGTGTYLLPIPSGYSIDTTNLVLQSAASRNVPTQGASDVGYGYADYNQSDQNRKTITVYVWGGATQNKLSFAQTEEDSENHYVVGSDWFENAAARSFSLHVSIPIQGWSAMGTNVVSMVEYVKVNRTTDLAVTPNTSILFNQTETGNIPYNSTTGQFTLKAGKTYLLNATAAINTGDNAFDFQWRTTTGTLLGSAATINGNSNSNIPAVAIFTPSADTVVTVYILAEGNSAVMRGGYVQATIQQIGSTASTGVTLNSLIAASANGSLDNANYAQTWSWSTADDETALTLTANALTTGTGLAITSSYASGNSTNGLLYVANTSAVTNGVIARIQSNSTAGSGLTVLANGNVGIGTTSPANKLDVEGVGRFISPGSDTTGGVVIRDNSNNNGNYLQFVNNAGTSQYAYIRGLSSGGLALIGGNVGIGMENPSVALDVTGDIEYTGIITDVSDASQKEHMVSLDGSLEKLMKLNAISFNMIGSDVKEIGFTAQNVQEQFPELVSVVDTENGILGLNYIGLIAPIVKSIQEQQAEIETNLDSIVALDLRTKNIVDVEDGKTVFKGTVIADTLKANRIEGLDIVTGEQLSDVDAQLVQNGQTLNDISEQLALLQAKLTGTELSLKLADLEVSGGVTFKNSVEFQGPAVFKKLAEFIDKVIFKNDVEFAGNVTIDKNITFNADTAGRVIITTGQTEVKVTFDNEYTVEPIVQVTPLDIYNLKYAVTGVSIKGFTVKIDQQQDKDVSFNWTAIAVNGAKTTKSDSVTPTPSVQQTDVPSTTITPTASPSPTIEPTSSPESSPSATLTN